MEVGEPLRPLILVCDDEAPLRELVRAVLGPDYRYVEAVNTAEAEQQLVREPPALIVLDVMLPGKSGLQFLSELRQDGRAGAVKVVVVSAWQAMRDKEAALEAGADVFLGKPFDPDELARVVRDSLSA